MFDMALEMMFGEMTFETAMVAAAATGAVMAAGGLACAIPGLFCCYTGRAGAETAWLRACTSLVAGAAVVLVGMIVAVCVRG